MQHTLQRGQIIPDFTLENINGERVSSRSFYMHRNYIVVLMPDSVDQRWGSWLNHLSQAVQNVPERDVICLVIIPAESIGSVTSEMLADGRVQLLIDSDGKIGERFGHSRSQGQLLLTDRYGKIFHAAAGDPSSPELDPAEIPSWIEMIASRCS